MDKILLQKDLFLGESEINVIIDNSVKDTLALKDAIINNFGIVKKESDTSFDSLKIIAGTSLNQIKINDGSYYDSNGNFVNVSTNGANFVIPTSVNPYSVVLRTLTTSEEMGFINISSSGQITCVGGTLEKLRAGDFPSRIKFTNSTLGNDSVYEIHSLISSTQAQLVGDSFVDESNLTYEIYGTFTQSSLISNPLLYEYNRFQVLFIPIAGTILDTDIVLGEVLYNGTIRNIVDSRYPIFTLNNVYTKTETYNKSETFTQSETKLEIKKNNLGVETLTNSSYNGTETLFISKDNSIFNIEYVNSGTGLYIGDIKYADNTEVETGKEITLQVKMSTNTGFRLLLKPNLVITSTILYPFNVNLESLDIPYSQIGSTYWYVPIKLYKTASDWVLEDNSLVKDSSMTFINLYPYYNTGFYGVTNFGGEEVNRLSASKCPFGNFYLTGVIYSDWANNETLICSFPVSLMPNLTRGKTRFGWCMSGISYSLVPFYIKTNGSNYEIRLINVYSQGTHFIFDNVFPYLIDNIV